MSLLEPCRGGPGGSPARKETQVNQLWELKLPLPRQSGKSGWAVGGSFVMPPPGPSVMPGLHQSPLSSTQGTHAALTYECRHMYALPGL